MYCRKCGTKNEENALKCVRCGETLQVINVPSYLAYAIIVTLLCCLPFGIVAIVYAAQVSGKAAGGDIEGAMDYSRKAKTWCWVSFGVGLTFTLLYMLMMAIGIVAGQ